MSRTKEDSHFHRHEEDSQAMLSSSALMLHSSPHRSRPRLLPRPLHSPPHAPPPVRAPETAPESSCGRLSAVVLKAEERLGKDLGIHALGDGDLGTVGTNEQLQALCEVVGAQGLIV